MATAEITLQNFSGGELSPKMYGRYELPIYQNGCRRMLNFIAETQGPARYRTGTALVSHTRRNQVAFLAKFEFNDVQAYQLEFTDKKLRFHKDNALITETSKAITGITKANPGVVTSNSHGFSNGDEVFIESVSGMEGVNGKFFIVAGVTTNTFELTDQDGVNVNTSSFTTYSSGGTVSRVYEIDTPYTEANNLFVLKMDQNADTMYVVHPFYEPRKLTRTGHTAWTLSRFSRTSDPFLDSQVISGITQANPGVVTAVAHGFAEGQVVIIEEVVGMTEVNSQPYVATNVAADTFELYDLDGNKVDTSGFTAYSSAGIASDQGMLPAAFTFYESRAWYGGPDNNPDKFFASRSPQNTGAPRYDDFTNGTDPDHALEYTIADAEVNKILWLKGTDRLLFAGTFGAEIKITGETDDKPISPTSINCKSVSRYGVANIAPINKENSVIYVQRGKRTLRSFEFDALSDAFISVDRNLVSDHITLGDAKQMAWQSGRPNVLWMVKEDGELLGVTYKSREDVSGWHRHRTYNGVDKFLSVSTMPRSSGYEQVWVVVERIVDGVTRRYVEYFTDEAIIPDPLDFFTSSENRAEDHIKFLRAMAEAQKDYIHVDSSLTYNGSDIGRDAGAAVTPAAVTGASVVFTATASVFKASYVGQEIWKKAIEGEGYGRAKIIAYTSATQVTCEILDDFDNDDAMAAGDWYLTQNVFGNLDHLEGRVVTIQTDGSKHGDKTVSNGSITLDYQASVIHVGLGYSGFLQPMSVEVAGVSGPSQTKPRNINQLGIKFLNSLGCEVGVDLYDPEEVEFSEMPLPVGNPDPLYTGVKLVPYSDNWENDKVIYIRQNNPSPCIVQLIAVYAEGDNN